MTYTLNQGRSRTKWDKAHGKNSRVLRTIYQGLFTSAASANAFTCGADEVALIDEIVVAGLTNDAATNQTCFLKVNTAAAGTGGHVLPIHLAGTANQMRNKRLVWRLKGNMVVQPGTGFGAYSSAQTLINPLSLSVRYRRMGLTEAIINGEIRGGRMPQVASTNSVAGGGTVAATAKAIVAATAGKSVEILGFTLTGHNYNAAADDIRLGFWDGTTGTFAANGNMVFRGYARGVSSVYAPEILVGDCTIQGPLGSGVYIQASANLAGATPTADYNIIYRVRDEIDTWTPLGTVNTTSTTRKTFWFFTEAAVSAAGVSVAMFPASTTGFGVRFKGHVVSAVSTDSGVASAEVSVGLGADHQIALMDYTVINGDGNAGAVSRTVYEDDIVTPTNVASAPGFIGIDSQSTVTQRSQLVWGSLETDATGGTEYVSAIP